MSLVTVSECGKGVNKDLLASELAPGLWSDALNVTFGNGFARKRKGIQTVYNTPTVVPYALQTFNTASARYVVQAGTASVFVDDGTTRTDITGTAPTGGRDDRWTTCDFNSILVMNNGVDAPMYWNGDTGTNLATLSAWPVGYKADTLRLFKNYLVAGAVTKAGVKYPQLLMWSNAAEPGAIPTAWTASTTNDAGDDPLAGMGAIVDFLPLGEMNVIYCQEGRAAMQYVGPNEVFRITPLPGRDGLKARGCVVETPKGHVFLSSGDVMIHTGGQAVSIAEGRIKSWLFSTMDTTNGNRAFLVLNPQETEVWVVFPSTGSTNCDKVAAWNWVNDSWAIHSVSNVTCATSGLVASALAGATWASDSGAWDADVSTWDQDEYSSNEARLILATSTPQIGLANTGSLDFGSRVSWYLEKAGISLGDSDTLKVLSRCRPHVKAVAGTQVVVKLASTMNPDDSPTFNNSSTYTQGTSNWANQFANAGRYAAVRFEGADDQTVAIRSYDFELAQSRARF